mgnify:CR=1 FL=1
MAEAGETWRDVDVGLDDVARLSQVVTKVVAGMNAQVEGEGVIPFYTFI